MTSIIITDKQLGQFIAAAYTGGLIAGDALCKETFSKATEVVAMGMTGCYDGYCPICGQSGCEGECSSIDGSKSEEVVDEDTWT